MQSVVSKIKRPECYVQDILNPHRTPRKVYHDDQAPLAVVNRKGEPRRALSTLMSFLTVLPIQELRTKVSLGLDLARDGRA
jgi:hypothetical protein